MTAPAAQAHLESRLSPWWTAWLALLPVLPPLALLGVLGLGWLRPLPRAVVWLLGLYGVSQGLAAVFSPDPLLALGLAALRTALVLGLLGLGRSLGHPRALRHLRWGLLVVYVTALTNGAALQGADLTQLRLTHPYYTPVSLALAGGLGLWLALDRWPDEVRRAGWWWRLPLGLLGVLTALLSGSRGPLGVALLGAVLLLSLGRRRGLAVLGAAGLVAALSLSGALRGTALERLGSLDVTGRDLVWNDALSVGQAFPVGGVGSYLLGARLAPPGQPCVWFEALEVRGIGCPQVVERLNSTWVIAHNGFLQQWGETGVIGTAGLFLLLGGLLAAVWRTRSPLAAAVVTGLLLVNLTDNVTLVPGPVFAEVFWLVGGWALSQQAVPGRTAALWGAGTLALSAFPLWASLAPAPPVEARLTGLIAPQSWRRDEPYAAAALLALPAGSYRVHLRACQVSCLTTAVRQFTVSAGQAPEWLWLTGPLPAAGQVGRPGARPGASTFTLEYRLSAGSSPPWNVQPLAQRRWTVQVEGP